VATFFVSGARSAAKKVCGRESVDGESGMNMSVCLKQGLFDAKLERIMF